MAYEVLADKATDERRWRAERTKRITATDATILMGASKWGTPLEVYAEKISQTPRAFEDTDRTAWGRRMEPVILAAYRETLPPTIGVAPDSRLLGSVEYPWLAASPDAWRREEANETLLEVKNTSLQPWDEPPQMYQIQVHVQMLVTGCELARILALFQGSDLREYEVAYRPDLGQAILDVTGDAWERIQHGMLPDPQGKADMQLLQKMFPPRKGSRALLPPESRGVLAQYQAAQAARKAAEAAEESMKAQLVGWLRDAEAGVIPGTEYEVRRSIVQTKPRTVPAGSYEKVSITKAKKAA